MYDVALMIFKVIQWTLLIVLGIATFNAISGLLRKSLVRPNRFIGKASFYVALIKLIAGLSVFLLFETGRKSLEQVLQSPELRFFGLENTFGMLIAMIFIYLGVSQTRKTQTVVASHRWAVSCFMLASIIVLTIMLWGWPILA
ncbi:MAG: hypothetical protein AAFP70_02900 [Calditrichota bacterium]